MARFKVVVLDQRPVAGGAAVTEEFSPGFSNSVASYAVSLLNLRSYATSISPLMDCASLSVRYLTSCHWTMRFLKVGGGQTKREVAKFSVRDADRLDDYQHACRRRRCFARQRARTPPNVIEGSPLTAIAELIKAGE